MRLFANLINYNCLKPVRNFDATEYGGAPLIGLKGLIVKCHGNAGGKEIRTSILQCADFAQAGLNRKIEEALEADRELFAGRA